MGFTCQSVKDVANKCTELNFGHCTNKCTKFCTENCNCEAIKSKMEWTFENGKKVVDSP